MLRVLATFIVGFILALMAVPASADSLSGTISVSGLRILFVPDSASTPFTVQAPSAGTAAILGRLSDGDSIIATGTLDARNNIASIESVDFVGLRKVIGRWHIRDAKGLMRFNTYQDVDVFSIALANGNSSIVAQKSLKYTVSPANNGDWIMFLSDDRSTQMGSFTLTDSLATLKLFNARTGDVSQVIRLQKVGL